MKQLLLTCLFSLLFLATLSGQGTIRGKVSDLNGEALIGVVISVPPTAGLGTVTDLNGSYSILIPDSMSHKLLVQFIGYKAQEEQIRVIKGEVILRNFMLRSASDTLHTVEITVKASKSSNTFMEKMKMNSATSIDYISAETMKKTGDANVFTAITRVSGVSTNGAFITVRGIGDRYIKTSINDMRIPTLDPFTNNIKLDMIPASLVDNVIITKTASPELPGDWAGAYINVVTKDYPEKLTISLETSVEYNAQTSFKNVVSTEKSSTDWLGYDNGLRDHPMNNYVPTNFSPTTYDEFVALGLGNYYKTLGVTHSWRPTDQAANTLLALGLVQLGFLDKSQINNPSAIAAANTKYNQSGERGVAFDRMNAAAIAWNKSFPNNWRTKEVKAPLNFSQNISIGNQILLFGKPLGIEAGFRYGSYVRFDPNSTTNRINTIAGPNGSLSTYNTINQQITKETNGWSGLLGLAYRYSSSHSISLLFMPNMTGVNNASNGEYQNNFSQIAEKQFYESRKQFIYQLKSEHYLPAIKMKIEGLASYTAGRSTAPDFKELDVPYVNGVIGVNSDIGALSVDRYYRYLRENIFDSRLNFEIPLPGDAKTNYIRKLKFGGAYQHTDRRQDQYDVNMNSGIGADQIALLEPNSDPFSIQKFTPISAVVSGVNTSILPRYYLINDLPTDHTFGYTDLTAGYLMLDYSLFPKLRISGGARLEQINMYTDAVLYDSLHIPSGDPRRHIDQFLPFNPGQLNELDLLPSISLIYKIKNAESAPFNLRLNFSQTVARPSLRELSSISVQDFELGASVTGNPELKSVHINNYDMRLEFNFPSGENISISGFYKEFKNHIELTYEDGLSGYFWINNPNLSFVKGIELEGRKLLTKHFEFLSNVTFADSHSSFNQALTLNGHSAVDVGTVSHTMFGQAPYVINAILSYRSDRLGLILALCYNIQGPRLVIDGNGVIPDVYELPRNLLDLKITKNLGSHFSLSFKVNNILNAPTIRSFKISGGYPVIYDRFSYGTNYIVSLLYKI